MSPKQKTELQRKKKDRPNKANCKKREQQNRANLLIIRELNSDASQADA